MKLDCFVPEGVELDIRPSSSHREWMDATLERFAYRCLPLSIANAHGWVIRCGGGFEAEWTGGNAPQDVHIFPVGDGPVNAKGHFGYGVLTLSPQAVFRTEPGYNLWISGPPNSLKDGIQGLSAVVEADWIPYHFTMNWRFTRSNHRVRFDKGEPYCFLFPVKRGLPEAMEPALRNLSDDAGIEQQVEFADRLRQFVGNVKLMTEERGRDVQIRNERELKFQKWYMKGQLPGGSDVFEGHQKSLQLRPFQDLRGSQPE